MLGGACRRRVSVRWMWRVPFPHPLELFVNGRVITCPGAPLLGDVTGGGTADLAIPSGIGTCVQTSTGSGFAAPQQWTSTAFYGSKATLVGDVNGDGKADLVAVNDGSTWVMLSNGSGYSAPQLWASTAFYGSRATLLADVNGDGKADLVAVNDGSTWVMLSNGSGYSAPQLWGRVPPSMGARPPWSAT
jgi:FG-GAP-like repeat